MASRIQMLTEQKLIRPPSWLPNNIMYETIMGSTAYGVNSGKESDIDCYGFCIPPKEMVFPHLTGEIFGFGRQIQRFEQYQQHHVKSEESEYDFSIYNIVKYFQLLMDNNPNMVDSLFTPGFCILHMTAVGQMVRDKNKLFLHKGAYHKFQGYAHSQLHKMASRTPEKGSKRDEYIEKYGYDVKYGYHLYRLSDELEQILTIGDIDLQRSREMLKTIRRGEMPEADLRTWFSEREKYLEKLYETSKVVPHSPDEDKIKTLLLECLEHHYGSLSKLEFHNPDAVKLAINGIKEAIKKFEEAQNG